MIPAYNNKDKDAVVAAGRLQRPALIGTLSYRLPTTTTASTTADAAAAESWSSKTKKRKRPSPFPPGDDKNATSSFTLPAIAATATAKTTEKLPHEPPPNTNNLTGWVLNDTWMVSLTAAALSTAVAVSSTNNRDRRLRHRGDRRLPHWAAVIASTQCDHQDQPLLVRINSYQFHHYDWYNNHHHHHYDRPIVDDTTTAGNTNDDDHHYHGTPGTTIVEVHDLCLLHNDTDDKNDGHKTTKMAEYKDRRMYNKEKEEIFLTLRQISRLERGGLPLVVEADLPASTTNNRSNSSSSNKTTTEQQPQPTRRTCYYSFRAVIAAVSPIIVMDDNPFALMELRDNYYHDDEYNDDAETYDDHYNSGSGGGRGRRRTSMVSRCLVVLRGPTLVYASADAAPVLTVGEIVHLHQVQRQRWRIPAIVPTAPSHVFVLYQVSQLTWPTATATTTAVGETNDDDENNNNNEDNDTDHFLSVHFKGTIRYVHWLPLVDGRRRRRGMGPSSSSSNTSTKQQQQQQHQLHCIDVEQDDDEHEEEEEIGNDGCCSLRHNNQIKKKTMIQIFVTYFPMSVALQCSLRTGTRIAAANLHWIGPWARAATLQSQLSIVQLASVSTTTADASSSPSLLAAPLTPYKWISRIRVPYAHLGLKRRLVSYILPSWRREAFDDDNSISVIPSIDDLVAALVPLPVSSATTTTTMIRNAYAEFFNHDPLSAMAAPNTSAVADIRTSAMTQLLGRLQQRGVVGVGWNASFRLDLQDLMENNDDKEKTHLYTLGYLKTSRKAGMAFGSLSDGHSETPIVFLSPQHDVAAGESRCSSFAWVEVEAVHVTCICISDATELHNGPSTKTLPYCCQQSSSRSSVLSGGAWLVLVDARLYVATIFMAAASIKFVGDLRSNLIIPTTTSPHYVTVEECLQSRELPPSAILGVLVRPWWTPTKLKSSIFHGLDVTVGHAAVNTADDTDPVSLPLQTIDFKPSIAIQNEEVFVGLAKTFIKECDVPLEHLSLGAVWWKVGDDASLCALLMGGWDDGQLPTTSEAVMVAIPSSALTQDPKRGFVRFRSSIDDLTVTMTRSSCSETMSSPLFHFESRSSKVVVGMLVRRPQRIGPSYDLVLSSDTLPGVPQQSIVRIFSDLLDDLRTQSRCHMRPSLVRAIPNATFLGVSYCRAHASCAKCHQELKLPKQSNQQRPALPCNNSTVGIDANDYRRTTALQCLNRCNVHLYGYIKWECSGILDDGTGQAKLYAEREAATRFLLNRGGGGGGTMTEAQRRFIEQGAWSVPGGIVFSKTTPPKSSLKYAVRAARIAATTAAASQRRWQFHHTTSRRTNDKVVNNNNSCSRRKITEDDVLRHMTVTARAEYLMEWMCRCPPHWQGIAAAATYDYHCRRRLYLVRCKPLADAVVHVGQTDVQLANHHDGIFTYTLPPLQLTLVDCADAVVEPGS